VSKKNSKKQTLTSSTDLLKPSEALTRLQLESIEDSVAESMVFEQIRYGFELGAIGLLTPIGVACEVMSIPRIYPLPNASTSLLGLINMRSNLVPVFDLVELLNIRGASDSETTTQSDSNLFVIGSGEKAVALIIKGLPQTVLTEIQETELPPIVDDAKKFVINAYNYQQRIWIDLDLEAYLMSLRSQLAA